MIRLLNTVIRLLNTVIRLLNTMSALLILEHWMGEAGWERPGKT